MIKIEKYLKFGKNGNTKEHLLQGWGFQEEDFCWTIGDSAELNIRTLVQMNSETLLRIKCLAFLGNGILPYQQVSIYINKHLLAILNITSQFLWHELTIPPNFISIFGNIILKFNISHPISPKELKLYDDHRKLGIRFTELQFISQDSENDTNNNTCVDDTMQELSDIGNTINKTTTKVFYPEMLCYISEIKNSKRYRLQNSNKSKFVIKIALPFFANINLTDLSSMGIDIVVEDPKLWLEQDNNNDNITYIYVLNNNNCMHSMGLKRYIEFYNDHPNDWIVVWDYDNHHWLSLSFNLAYFCDVYIPAHLENLSLLGQLASHNLEVLSCGTEQFSKHQIRQALQSSMFKPRKMEPIGMHKEYPFPVRNHVIKEFGKLYSEVGFIRQYDINDSEKNLSKWMSFSCSLISPVNGDLPLRVFDSLITGGIPIVPYYLEYRLTSLGVPSNYFITYRYSDLNTPDKVVEKANKIFIEQGDQGIEDRVNYTLTHHHIHTRLIEIFNILRNNGCVLVTFLKK